MGIKIKVPKKLTPKSGLLIAGLIIILAVFGYAIIHHSLKKTTVIVPKGPESPQIDATTGKGTQSNNSNSSSSSSSPSNSANKPATDQSRINVSLAAPSGQLSGTQAPPAGATAAITQTAPSLNATCLTLADASCVVELTSPSGGVTTINPSSNDGQGNFVFNWSGAGYATGTWQVAIVATKNGASSQANIGPLAVQP